MESHVTKIRGQLKVVHNLIELLNRTNTRQQNKDTSRNLLGHGVAYQKTLCLPRPVKYVYPIVCHKQSTVVAMGSLRLPAKIPPNVYCLRLVPFSLSFAL